MHKNGYDAIVYHFLLYGIEISGNAGSCLISPLLTIPQGHFQNVNIPHNNPWSAKDIYEDILRDKLSQIKDSQ